MEQRVGHVPIDTTVEQDRFTCLESILERELAVSKTEVMDLPFVALP